MQDDLSAYIAWQSCACIHWERAPKNAFAINALVTAGGGGDIFPGSMTPVAQVVVVVVVVWREVLVRGVGCAEKSEHEQE